MDVFVAQRWLGALDNPLAFPQYGNYYLKGKRGFSPFGVLCQVFLALNQPDYGWCQVKERPYFSLLDGVSGLPEKVRNWAGLGREEEWALEGLSHKEVARWLNREITAPQRSLILMGA